MGHGSNNYFAVKLRAREELCGFGGLTGVFPFWEAPKTKQPRFSAGLLGLKSVDVQGSL